MENRFDAGVFLMEEQSPAKKPGLCLSGIRFGWLCPFSKQDLTDTCLPFDHRFHDVNTSGNSSVGFDTAPIDIVYLNLGTRIFNNQATINDLDNC